MQYVINMLLISIQYEIVCLTECLRMTLDTFMRVAVDHTTCKELLVMYLKEHAPQLYPLPSSTSAILVCDKLSETVQSSSHGHDEVVKDCTVFLDCYVTLAIPYRCLYPSLQAQLKYLASIT